MTHEHIISELGGYATLATEFGLHRSATFRWKTQGIPLHWWSSVEKLARRQGRYDITEQVLLETRPKTSG